MTLPRLSIVAVSCLLVACSGSGVVNSEINDSLPTIGTARVAGVVVDRTGQAIPGLKVQALFAPQRTITSATAVSDSLGQFEFAIYRFAPVSGAVLPETTEVRVIAASGDRTRASLTTMVVIDSVSRPILRTVIRLVEP